MGKFPEYIVNYDDVIPLDCFMAPCCSCGQRMVCNQSTTICCICEASYKLS